jgi:HK97 gp10 family phage protein
MATGRSASVDFNANDKVHDAILSDIAEALADAGQAAERYAVTNVPVSDQAPHVRDNIKASAVDERGGLMQVDVIATSPDEPMLPIYIEFGTGIYAKGGRGRKTPWVYSPAAGVFFTTQGMHAQPFMGPAYEVGRRVAIEMAKRVG